MSYIYHLRPQPMEGEFLIPLNLMDQNTELYKRHAKKYEGRESLPEQVIPLLNCKWNDVVQFSALDPRIIEKELRKYNPKLVINRPSIFKIPIEKIIDKYEAVIFDRDLTRGKGSYEVLRHEVKWFSKENYSELSEVPKATIEYWKGVQKEGGVFLFFPFVTHIMVKGTIDTSEFEIVSF